MTKLMQWLSVFFILLSIYSALITGQIKSDLINSWMFQIQIFPIVAIGLFGVSNISSLRRKNQKTTTKIHNIFALVYLLMPLIINFIWHFIFQFYSVFTILYRVFTFNDCPEAAAEIQKQILEAKADLTAKGLTF